MKKLQGDLGSAHRRLGSGYSEVSIHSVKHSGLTQVLVGGTKFQEESLRNTLGMRADRQEIIEGQHYDGLGSYESGQIFMELYLGEDYSDIEISCKGSKETFVVSAFDLVRVLRKWRFAE